MKNKFLFLFILLWFFYSASYASYIKGKVTDQNGEPLPFATVYIHNTTYGVTTNTLGNYFIELKPGSYSITYSFIGYQPAIYSIDLGNEPQIVDVILQTASTQLNEIEIYSSTKNKAKEVMGNVRKNRKKYLAAVTNYSCNTYMKNSLIKELIKKKKNDEINLSFEKVDSTKKTNLNENIEEEILNLIESYSITNFKSPGKYKEQFLGYHDFADTQKETGLDISAEFGYGEYSIVPNEQEQEDQARAAPVRRPQRRV